MDSLLANYASSDDEEQDQSPQAANPQPPSESTPSSSTIFSSLPPPKSHLLPASLYKSDPESLQFEVADKPKSSSSIFSLPPPKSSISSLLPPPKFHLPGPILSSSEPTYVESKSDQFEVPDKPKSSSSIFSRLPPPKSQSADPFSLNSLPIAQPNPRKVVQLKLPVNPSMLKSRDSDDEDDEDKKEREGRKPAVETASVTSFLSSIPAPKNSSSFGALPSAAGSGRRSILEADVPTIRSNDSKPSKSVAEMPAESNLGTYDGQWADGSISAPLTEADSSVEYAYGGEGDASGWVSANANYEAHDGYSGYENYSYYEQHDGNWGDASTATAAAQSSMVQMNDSSVNIPRKRGRNDIPQDIIEVKQDELMKNRPREDQVKLTGIAFGPSYQPVSTTKGKPSKLHKRKHQIGTLYFDMRQKEMELAERRSKGLLTKAETHAKYGW